MTSASKPPIADALLEALRAHPDATAAQLADLIGCGRSTIAKALAALAATSQITRRPGGRDAHGRRQPDRWRLLATTQAAPADPEPAPSAAADPSAGDGAPDIAPPAPSDPDHQAEPASPPSATEASSARLRPGALRAQVLDYLTRHSGDEFTPHQLAKAIGARSAGAVINALGTLASLGEVLESSRKPRRYVYLPPAPPQQTSEAAR